MIGNRSTLPFSYPNRSIRLSTSSSRLIVPFAAPSACLAKTYRETSDGPMDATRRFLKKPVEVIQAAPGLHETSLAGRLVMRPEILRPG